MQIYADSVKDNEYQALVRAKSYEDLCEIYNLTELSQISER